MAQMQNPAEAIVSWASDRLNPWQQDALRRLATTEQLTDTDRTEVIAHLRNEAGFEPPVAVPNIKSIEVADIGSGAHADPITLKGIRNIQSVNRLAKTAGLEFGDSGLSIIYGPNGSGKTGFVRILRTACRTRVSDPKKLKVLVDVYGAPPGPQQAELVITTKSGDVPFAWTEGSASIAELRQVSVFDSKAAELYCDEGNEITFLPFGLSLPFKLNSLSVQIRSALQQERTQVQTSLQSTGVAWEMPRDTAAQLFVRKVSAATTDAEIQAAVAWTQSQAERVASLTEVLRSTSARAKDLEALAAWLDTVSKGVETAADVAPAEALAAARKLTEAAKNARQAADLAARGDFAGDPLPGIGNEAWRLLWAAAREYVTTDAYPGRDFPVMDDGPDGDPARCPLCMQTLDPNAKARLTRFESFVSGKLNKDADAAEAAVATAKTKIETILSSLPAVDANRILQVKARNEDLGAHVESVLAGYRDRCATLVAVLEDGPVPDDVHALAMRTADVIGLTTLLRDEVKVHTQATDPAERERLNVEFAELTDQKLLAAEAAKVTQRRDLLKIDQCYERAFGLSETGAITRKATELVNTYLTKRVLDQFSEERKSLDIDHLMVGLNRKTDREGASFQTVTNTKLTNKSSDILSEGEQRALALAGFFTETALSMPNSPIIIDDPVSSLDRARGQKVSMRIVQAARGRQVIVFTHDLIFCNDLAQAADRVGIKVSTTCVVRNQNGAGITDPAGEPWKGKQVGKRLNMLKSEFVSVAKLHETSAAQYEYHTKNIYSRLRDTYERAVEEVIFYGVIDRYSEVVKTQNLRYVALPDDLAKRFEMGMTKANTHSHDNPSAGNVPVPDPNEVRDDFVTFEKLVADFKTVQSATEKARA